MLREGDRVFLKATWWLYRDKPAAVCRLHVNVSELGYVTLTWPDGSQATLKLDAIGFVVTCDHPGCRESYDVARDCWLSRTP